LPVIGQAVLQNKLVAFLKIAMKFQEIVPKSIKKRVNVVPCHERLRTSGVIETDYMAGQCIDKRIILNLI
jgi:hypothetical protein